MTRSASRVRRPSTVRRAAAAVALLVAAAPCAVASPATASVAKLVAAPSRAAVRPTATGTSSLVLGAYTGPAAKGVEGARRFEAFADAPVRRALDFAATGSWWSITGPDWMLDPWSRSGRQLEYSLPLFPDGTRGGLRTCAAGGFDTHWRALGAALVRKRLSDTVVRPGWEFNGTWYGWSAKGLEAAYAGCFRHVVTTMRAVPGQRFVFDWNPAAGRLAFPAELAYPGDAYVDLIGVDVYDTLCYYPKRGETGAWLRDVQRKVWAATRDGDHGLTWWAAFARAHGKPLSLTEWGLTSTPGGHPGADDPVFVDGIADFVADPANRVAAALYFDAGSTQRRHQVTRDGLFSVAGPALRERLHRLAAPGTSAGLVLARPVSGRTAQAPPIRVRPAQAIAVPAPRPGTSR